MDNPSGYHGEQRNIVLYIAQSFIITHPTHCLRDTSVSLAQSLHECSRVIGSVKKTDICSEQAIHHFLPSFHFTFTIPVSQQRFIFQSSNITLSFLQNHTQTHHKSCTVGNASAPKVSEEPWEVPMVEGLIFLNRWINHCYVQQTVAKWGSRGFKNVAMTLRYAMLLWHYAMLRCYETAFPTIEFTYAI